MRRLFALLLISLASFVPTTVSAAPVTVSTGDLGNNVIDDAGFFEVFLAADSPSNLLPASITIKYGLWNSPDVAVSVFFNGSLVGSFDADQAYITPGPEFITLDVTGLLVDGSNSIAFNGFGANSGDYVIGQVDLDYDDSGQPAVPEPTTWLLLGSGFLAIATLRRKR